MNETKNKGGRPKKDASRLLGKTLQVKVTFREADWLDQYCQASGIERADYLRKRILAPINAWWAKQPQNAPESENQAPESPVDTPEVEKQAPLPVPEPVVAEKYPELPENQAPTPSKPEKALKRPKELPNTSKTFGYR